MKIEMKNIEIYKHLSWKIKYEAGDMPYPPVLFWDKNISSIDIKNWWKKTINIIKKQKVDHNMWLYVHIPFCYTHCFFCTCVTKVEHKENKYDYYLDFIEKEAKLFTDIFKDIEFNTVYVWGWTPTILTAKQIDRFYNILKKYFNLKNVSQIMTEGSPYTTTEDKMKILASHWVNKITFWVQSLDNETLKVNNRFQQFDDVKNAINFARKYWIKYINLDLMAWVPWQNLQWFKETVDLIEKLNPTTVHVNAFWPTKNTNYIKTWNKYNYENIKLRNEMEKYGKFLEDLESKITDTSKKNLQLYNSHNYNSSILWLWYWAISHAFWWLHYTKNSFDDYINFVNWKKVFLNWYKLNINGEIISYLINNLRWGIYFKNFKNLFGIELEKTKIFKKINILLNKKILVIWDNEKWKYIKFKYNSDLYSAIYSKYLYDEVLIKKFILYMKGNKKEFINLDLRLKQFFTD